MRLKAWSRRLTSIGLNGCRIIIRRIATAGWGVSNIPVLMLALIAAVWGYAFVYESRFRAFLQSSFVRVSLAVAMLLYLCLGASGGGAFIYFQF